MFDENYFYPKGSLFFWYDTWKIRTIKKDYPIWHDSEILIIGDLMSGHDFFDEVDKESIINDDGMLGVVFVDDYVSNLGLCHGNFYQGGFIVDGDTWLSICDDHDVKVEWCNK